MDKQALWEAVKLPLRLLVLAVLPFAIAYAQQYDAQYAVVASGLLVMLDKYLHVYGKDNNKPKLVKGLTRF